MVVDEYGLPIYKDLFNLEEEEEEDDEYGLPIQKNLLKQETKPPPSRKSYAELMPGNDSAISQLTDFNKKVLGITENIFNTVAGSGAGFGASIADFADMAVDFVVREDKQTWFEDYAENSKAFADKKTKEGAWEDNLDIVGSIKKGNYGEAVSKGVQGVLQNSAQLITIAGAGIMSAGTVNPASVGLLNSAGAITSGAVGTNAPLTLIMASAGGSQYASLDDRTDLSLNQKITSGLFSSAIEGATETLGTLRYLDDIARSVPGADKMVRSTLSRVVKGLIDPKKIAANAGSEFIEEYSAGFLNDLTNSLLGVNDMSIVEVLLNYEQYLNEGAIGALSGTAMSGGAQMAQYNEVVDYNKNLTTRQEKADHLINWLDEGSNFNVNDTAKKAIWKDAVDYSDPSKLLSQFQRTQDIIDQSDLTYDEASEIINKNMEAQIIETSLSDIENQTVEPKNIEETEEESTAVETDTSKINLNTASKSDLLKIEGIGSATADNIITSRTDNPLASEEDLLKIKGIGQSTLGKMDTSQFIFEVEEVEDTTEDITEPDDEDIITTEDEIDVEDMDPGKLAGEVEREKGTGQTRVFESGEAENLLEYYGTDIRDVVDETYDMELEDITENDAEMIAEDINLEEKVREAILIETGFYYSKSDDAIKKTLYKKMKDTGSSEETHGTDQGIEVSTRTEIENIIRNDLSLPLRYGRLKLRNTDAQFDRVFEVVRTRDYSNMEVTSHEVGHFLSKKLDFSTKKFPELIEILKGEGMDTLYPRISWSEEGNSEFFKYYFNYPSVAQMKAPEYYDYVEQVIAQSDIYDAVKNLQGKMSQWNKQDSKARVSGAMSREKLKIPEILSFKDKAVKILIDEDITFKAALKKAGYNLEDIPAYKNPWILKRLYASVNDNVNTMIKEYATSPLGENNGESLVEILNPVFDYIGETNSREFGDFEIYSLAKHAVEREATFLMNDLNEAGTKRAKQIADSLKIVIEDGDTEAMIKALKTAQAHPEQLIEAGMELEDGEYSFRAVGIKLNDLSNTIDELDSDLFNNTLEKLNDYQDNLIDYSVYYDMLSEDAADDIKNAYNFHMPLHRYFGEELVNEGTGMNKRYADLPEVIKAAYGSTRIIQDPVRGLIKDTAYIIRQSKKNNVTVKFMDLLDSKPGYGELAGRIMRVDQKSGNENTINYRVDGELLERTVHPEIYKVLQGLEEETATQLKKMLKFLEVPNRVFKRFAVISPRFWVNNLFRDEGREIVYADNGLQKLKLFSSVVDGVMPAFGLDSNDVDGVFKSMGGARGGWASYLKNMDSPETIAQLKKTQTISYNPLEMMGTAAQATEDTRRKGIFVNKVEELLEGRSLEELSMEQKESILTEAAYHAKGGVLEDYSIKGKWTKEVDRYAIPFAAAGVTGARHLYKKLQKPSTWIAGFAFITLANLALWSINKDKPEYQELPAWKKMLYYNYVRKDGTIVSSPKPFITGYFFGSIPEMIANYAYNKDGEEALKNFSTIFKAGLPNHEMSGILPYLQMSANRTELLGDRKIVPEDEKFLDKQDQYGDYTNESAKLASEILGLGSFGLVNVSPRMIDHFVRGQFTSTGAMINDVINYGAGSQEFMETTMSMIGVYSDPFISSPSMDNLYKEREKYNAIKQNAREQAQLKKPLDKPMVEILEAQRKSYKLNAITSQMSTRRKISKVIDTLDINDNLKEQAKLYLNIENINAARLYYDKSEIQIEKYMSREEWDAIQDLISWVNANY